MGAVDARDTQITVALLGGHRLREQCLARYLEMSGFNTINGAKDNLRETLVDQAQAPDIVLIDTGSQTCTDARLRSLLASLQAVLPEVPIAVLSDREDRAAVNDALDFGVRGYFPSSLDPKILFAAFRLVQAGGAFIPADTRTSRGRTQRTELGGVRRRELTSSENRVLDLLTKGYSNKLIAGELNVTESTVKVHVRRIMKKLNAANRTQAALIAQERANANPRCS